MLTGILLSLAGGLSLFLFGMHVMSEGIEKAAGAKMRSILEFFTTNRFTGMLVGVAFTAIIQSSSACTALVVAFVNSGLMTLGQAVGVILGSNIGTTVTSQLVSFNLSAYAPAISMIGVICLLFIKQSFVKKIGEVLIGFGVLFMGLTNMKDAMSGIKEMPAVTHAFSSLTSPLLAVLLGLVITTIVQSSSVTVSITLLMASQGLLGLPICLYIILGCNIGACSTAMLASLSGNKMAKRAALIHLLFNVIGTLIMYVILLFAMDPVVSLIEMVSGPDMGRAVANAHTIFKIFQVVILFPFGSGLVKLTYLIVPGEDEKIGYRANMQLKFIGGKNIFSPATAVVEVTKELDRMATLASENLNRAMNALITLDEDDIKEAYEVEQNINYLNKEITHYLVKISQTNLPVEDAKSIGALFHVVNDIERIGDHAENAVDAAVQRSRDHVNFSKAAMGEMGQMLDMVNTIIRFAIEMFTNNDETHMQDVRNLEEAIDEQERVIQQAHVERMTKGECTAEAGMIFSDIISGLERVADHAVNIAFSMYENQ